MEEGSATVVHARSRRPNALRMLGADDETSIGSLAEGLLQSQRVQVVAIPHITWKKLGGGLRWRTPVAIVGALATALLLMSLPSIVGLWVALPAAIVTGTLIWLLLRHRTPTRIGAADGVPTTIDDVFRRVQPFPDTSPAPHARAACPLKDTQHSPSRIQ